MIRCPKCSTEIDVDEDEVEEGKLRLAPSANPSSKFHKRIPSISIASPMMTMKKKKRK